MAAQLGDALQPYMHGKGTLRFPADELIPDQLVRQIVWIRIGELRSGN
jgi:hypothetical protein